MDLLVKPVDEVDGVAVLIGDLQGNCIVSNFYDMDGNSSCLAALEKVKLVTPLDLIVDNEICERPVPEGKLGLVVKNGVTCHGDLSAEEGKTCDSTMPKKIRTDSDFLKGGGGHKHCDKKKKRLTLKIYRDKPGSGRLLSRFPTDESVPRNEETARQHSAVIETIPDRKEVELCPCCQNPLITSVISSVFCLKTGNVNVTCRYCGTVTHMLGVYKKL